MRFAEIKRIFNCRGRHRHGAPLGEMGDPGGRHAHVGGPWAPAKGDGTVFPLAFAAKGQRLRIVKLAGGKGLGRRLMDLGLPMGAEIEVVHRQGVGRMVVARQRARVALGAGMTQKIMVTWADGGDACRDATPG